MFWAYLLISFLAATMPTEALAQASSQDPHVRAAGPNGGKVEHAGGNHIELVVKDSAVRVYIYGRDLQPVAAEGAEVSVALQAKGQRETVKLKPAGANQMAGTTGLTAESGLRAVVALKMPGQPVAQARFSM